MPIKFACSCGKHLRARDEMAARRSLCPRCGAPVGIPSLQPTHRGATLGPLSLVAGAVTRQAAPLLDLASPTAAAAASALLATAENTPPALPDRAPPARPDPPARQDRKAVPLPGGGWPRRRYVETHWYQSLLLPWRAWPLVLGLAFVLTVLSGGGALGLAELLARFRAAGAWLGWLCLPFFSIPLAILGYGSGFLDSVLTSAMAGEVGTIRWPGRDFVLALRSGARWLSCFLAGPAVLAGLSVLYWIHAGELMFLDWLILIELNVLAVSIWFLLLLAAHQQGRLRDANPLRVLELIRRLGHRLVAWAVFAAVMVLGHGWLASVALEKLHRDVATGGSLLFLAWISGLLFAGFLFRWVGVWIYWDRVRSKQRPLKRGIQSRIQLRSA
jgi:hypothetical protein